MPFAHEEVGAEAVLFDEERATVDEPPVQLDHREAVPDAIGGLNDEPFGHPASSWPQGIHLERPRGLRAARATIR